MTVKTIIGIIFILTVGLIGIFFWSKNFTLKNSELKSGQQNQSIVKSKSEPSPRPSLLPSQIDEKTDLKFEIRQLNVPDFSKDYQDLHSEVETTF